MKEQEPGMQDEEGIVDISPEGLKPVPNLSIDTDSLRNDDGVLGQINPGKSGPELRWKQGDPVPETTQINAKESEELTQVAVKIALFVTSNLQEKHISQNDVDQMRNTLGTSEFTWQWIYETLSQSDERDWAIKPIFFLAIASEARKRISEYEEK